ncbi:hypothetical protein DGWBC_0429 [Dehalogenimonas sp. WBC-2]|nr:hypothetical protein DGWBC_0429 [Dehalogenimonas sp. WBC-2]
MGGGGGGYTGGISDSNELEELAKKRLEKLNSLDKTCNLFVPHSWDHEGEYQRLLALLKDTEDFEFKDYSIPREDAIDADTAKQLEEGLKDQIYHATVVLIPAGMYVTYSGSIQKEIELSKQLGKPIVAVKPWGSEVIPTILQENADIIVGWNKDSIVEAINTVRAKKQQH